MSQLSYRCEPFKSWLKVEHCEANQALAERSEGAPPMTDDRLNGMLARCHCPTCPGVVALSKAAGEEPRNLAAEIGHTNGKRPSKPRPRKQRIKMMTSDLVTVRQAAAILGITTQGTYSVLRDAEIKQAGTTKSGPGGMKAAAFLKADILELKRQRDEEPQGAPPKTPPAASDSSTSSAPKKREEAKPKPAGNGAVRVIQDHLEQLQAEHDTLMDEHRTRLTKGEAIVADMLALRRALEVLAE